MTSWQNAWATLFNLGPDILLGFLTEWWVAIVALVATIAFSWALLPFTLRLSGSALQIAAWIKPPLVASLIFSGAWWLFA